MDAYQYFFDADGNQTGYQQVGEMDWHAANHKHWHFEDFARYRLLNADKTQAVRRRSSRSAWPTPTPSTTRVPDADWQPENTDLSQRLRRLDALSIREVLSAGSGDTYAQYRAGQAFKIKDLPNGIYYIARRGQPASATWSSPTPTNNDVAPQGPASAATHGDAQGQGRPGRHGRRATSRAF